ncbi:265_t:CDS:2, partial [Cetraspora pellucida]
NPNKTQNEIKDEFNSKYQLNLDKVKHSDLEKALNIWINQAVAS